MLVDMLDLLRTTVDVDRASPVQGGLYQSTETARGWVSVHASKSKRLTLLRAGLDREVGFAWKPAGM